SHKGSLVFLQYYILLLSLFSTIVRYVLHTIDSFREHPWDKKTTYLLYVDIVVGILRLALYIEFTLAMWSLHPFPLFIARPIYLSVRALKKAVRDVLMSRRAIRYMNTVFRDATSADLAASSDTVCIICREDMQVSSGTAQPNPSSVLKRLPCSHIFHVSCLRSWFQRQQTCPTCRMDIIFQVRLQENHRGLEQVGRAAAPGSSVGASAPTPPTSTSSVTQAENNAAVRPPWMPGPGQFPMFPPFWGGQLPNVPTAPQSQGGASVPGMSTFPPLHAPFFAPPFVGMPIIYSGNLFPNATTPMPEPPSTSPDSATEARLRASAEARFTALRQINVLLNAAVLQMNTYLSAVSEPSDVPNPWVAGFGPAVTNEEKATDSISVEQATERALEPNDDVASSEEVSPSQAMPTPSSSGDDQLSEVRRRRLERFEVQAEDSSPNVNRES
ncbi:Synovial apoptosis inhibitor 1 synoviolin, partial [Fasciola gigantica]